MLPDEEQVVVFEIAERTELEYDHNGYNLTVGKCGLAVAAYLAVKGQKRLLVHLLVKFFTKLITAQENSVILSSAIMSISFCVIS